MLSLIFLLLSIYNRHNEYDFSGGNAQKDALREDIEREIQAMYVTLYNKRLQMLGLFGFIADNDSSSQIINHPKK